MAISMNNHVFKGHKTLLGSKFVTYGEVELPTHYDIFSNSNVGFDWGNGGSSSVQLGFAILYQLTNKELAEENAVKFTNDIVRKLNSRDWVLTAGEVLSWIEKNCKIQKQEPEIQTQTKEINTTNKLQAKSTRKPRKKTTNVVKEVCKELGITQKQLANVLEVPEGTVSSWAVKNEIPRLGKKAIEFYILNVKNQKIVDSYRSFQNLLQAS
jgi:DNA-binding transcriptional regulator YiaG